MEYKTMNCGGGKFWCVECDYKTIAITHPNNLLNFSHGWNPFWDVEIVRGRTVWTQYQDCLANLKNKTFNLGWGAFPVFVTCLLLWVVAHFSFKDWEHMIDEMMFCLTRRSVVSIVLELNCLGGRYCYSPEWSILIVVMMILGVSRGLIWGLVGL